MCLIIDSDTVHRVFPSPSIDYVPVFRALTEKRAKLAYGGELKRAYQGTSFRRILFRLDQQGSTLIVPDAPVDAETRRLARDNVCSSNDHHILALAIVGRVRLLCSLDNDLAADFRNPKILKNPRGSVYRNTHHIHLITRHCRQRPAH